MSLQISPETETRLAAKAQECGVSVEVLLERFLNESGDRPVSTPDGKVPKLPVWNIGITGSLHRRDIYEDVG